MNQIHFQVLFILKSTLILASHLRLSNPSGLFLSRFLEKMYTLLIFPMRATCPVHPIHLDFTTLKYEVKSTNCGASYYAALSSPSFPSSFLGANILLSILYSGHPQSVFFPYRDKPEQMRRKKEK
jgi:hypothetical protein